MGNPQIWEVKSEQLSLNWKGWNSQCNKNVVLFWPGYISHLQNSLNSFQRLSCLIFYNVSLLLYKLYAAFRFEVCSVGQSDSLRVNTHYFWNAAITVVSRFSSYNVQNTFSVSGFLMKPSVFFCTFLKPQHLSWWYESASYRYGWLIKERTNMN